MHSETKRRARNILLSASLGGLWLALAGAAFANASAPAPSIRIENAWIRWLPSGVPAGGYLTLTNTGERALTLIGASSTAFGMVSVHRTVHHGGNVGMEPAGRISIAAHSTLDFAAAGYHLMLMDASTPLKPGDHVSIILSFADGTSLSVPFEVRQ